MKMDLLPYNSEMLLSNFPPILRKHFKELFCNGKIGLSSITLNDITPIKQCTKNNTTFSYHYTLRVPYAGKRLSWELIFDPEDLTFPPDFNFNNDAFFLSSDLASVVENIPSLMNWNVNNPKALTSLLTEFLALYKKQQLQKLEQENIYSQLNSEYQILTEEISLDDMEICLESTVAHFLINIRVDTSSLPEYLQPTKDDGIDELLNPGEDTCLLKISYLKLDGSKINTSLQMSPRLDQVLGNTRTLHIPNYSKTTSLANYVNLTIKLLHDLVKRIEQHHILKKAYVSCLCTIFGENLIEFDSDTFTKCVLLCEIDGYHCLVYIEISEHFPEEKPSVSLQSLYCITSSTKICLEKIDYLYNPKWSPLVAAKNLATTLLEAVPKLKNHKH